MVAIFKGALTAQTIKEKARALGADLVGIADGAALEMHPPDPKNPQRPSDITDHDGARVIVQGQDEGTFRQADPLLTYFTIMPSILMFFARQRLLSRRNVPDVAAAAPRETNDFIQHVQTAARAMLRKDHS